MSLFKALLKPLPIAILVAGILGASCSSSDGPDQGAQTTTSEAERQGDPPGQTVSTSTTATPGADDEGPPAGSLLPPEDIASDCSADVTMELDDWLDSVPDGEAEAPTVLSFPDGACYRMENTLLITDRNHLSFVGNGAEFRATTDGASLPAWDGKEKKWPSQRRHFNISGGSDIAISDVLVTSINSTADYDEAREGQHGFNLAGGVAGVLLTDVEVRDVYGDFVHVGEATDVVVRASAFSGAGRQGFAVSQGEDILFEGNTITRVARSAVDIEPKLDWIVRRVTIRDNDISTPIGNTILANQGTGSAVEDIVFEDNDITGEGMWVKLGSPSERRRTRYTFVGNTSDTLGNRAILFQYIDGIVVRDNIVPIEANSGFWLRLCDVTDEVVEGNQGEPGTIGYECPHIGEEE